MTETRPQRHQPITQHGMRSAVLTESGALESRNRAGGTQEGVSSLSLGWGPQLTPVAAPAMEPGRSTMRLLIEVLACLLCASFAFVFGATLASAGRHDLEIQNTILRRRADDE